MVQLTNGQHTCELVFKLNADILNIRHDYQFVFSVLGELYASHHAAGVVLRGHYKSMKCDVLFSQGSVRTIFRWGGHFSYISKKISSCLQQCKNYKNRSIFFKVMITDVLPPFHGSMCIYKMLSYSRETALQGTLILTKSGRLKLGDNIFTNIVGLSSTIVT